MITKRDVVVVIADSSVDYYIVRVLEYRLLNEEDVNGSTIFQ